jgi:hypothetical protein
VSALVYANGTTDNFSVQIDHDNGGALALNSNRAVQFFEGFFVSADHAGSLAVPKCMALRTATQSLPSGAWTPLQFTAADLVDTAGMHDPASNADKFYARVAGWYHVECSVNVDGSPSGAGQYRLMDLAVSNALNVTIQSEYTNSAAGYRRGHLSGDVYLRAGDYCFVELLQDSGVAHTINSSQLTIRLVPDNAAQPLVAEDWKTFGADGGATAFQSGWAGYSTDYAPQYRKDQFGMVHLRGLVKYTPGNMIVWPNYFLILPVGYRPRPAAGYFAPLGQGHTGSAYTSVFPYVDSAGKIGFTALGAVIGNTSGYAGLDGVSFRAEG